MTLNDSTGSVQEIMGWTLVGLNITHHSVNRVSSRGKEGKSVRKEYLENTEEASIRTLFLQICQLYFI